MRSGASLTMVAKRAPTKASAPGPTPKRFRKGTHRAVTPAETLGRARTLFGPLGITRVANVTGLDTIGIPVTMVCRPNARSLAVSQGKGLDLAAAQASGVMESIELYHAENVTLPLKLASYNQLRFSCSLAAIGRLPLVSISAYHPDLPILWIEGLDLLGGRPTWVPFELVHMNYTVPFPTGSGCFVMSSNGLASGNEPAEAISHALCEVIERDAIALFHCNSRAYQDAARVDLATVTDPDARGILDRYERAGLDVGVWDATSDVGIATYLCVVVERSANSFRQLGPMEGMGCHPVREIALLRALTEAAQGRLTLIAGSRDDNGRARYEEISRAAVIEQARARLSAAAPRRFTQTPSRCRDSFEDDLAELLGRLRRVGIEQAIVIDLTKSELGIPVFRVVVPGLEAYHRVQGYVPGTRARRLLDQRRREASR